MVSWNAELETKVVQRFVLAHKQERCLGFLMSEILRMKLVAEMSRSLDLSLFSRVVGDEGRRVLSVAGTMNIPGICYIISEHKPWDMKQMAAPEALRLVVGSDLNSLLVFDRARLVYFEGEGFNNRWLSSTPNRI